MKKSFVLIFLLSAFLIPQKAQSFGMSMDIHAGVSGTSAGFLLILYLDSLDEEVDIIDYGDIQFFTGEIGTTLRFEFGNFGFAYDFVLGYYLHFATTPNIVSYTLIQNGMELYYILEKTVRFGFGIGYFFGNMYMDYGGYDSTFPASYKGIASWIFANFEFGKYIVIGASFRYHRFLTIGDLNINAPENEFLINDMIFCLRVGARIHFVEEGK